MPLLRAQARRRGGGYAPDARRPDAADPAAWGTGSRAGAAPTPLEALAQRAVEVARAAGATYADARVTRTVQHHYNFFGRPDALDQDIELVGLGVRALVNGYWGFSASPLWDPEEAVRLAQEAVAQAKINARGTPRAVELGEIPAVQGRWATPVMIDPFSISIEEKSDTIAYWLAYAQQVGVWIDAQVSWLSFARQEQTLATSTGTLVSQTLHESGGVIWVKYFGHSESEVPLTGIDVCGKGWELFLDADIPGQLRHVPERIAELSKISVKPATIGRYTLVCDGVTMARIVEQTFGIVTQLDRALGYEANAGGTSYLDDPLSMLGSLQVAAPMVTVTANRSAPTQLATVKWDAEGVEPHETTLVKNGVLTDYQTTREQATWLAPYYQKTGKPVTSHGYASAEDALSITLQHMPNLAMAPAKSAVELDDLISTVKDGILVTNFALWPHPVQTDHQARNGTITGWLRQIKNGRLGAVLAGEVGILFNTPEFWKKVVAVGGPSTQGVASTTAFNPEQNLVAKFDRQGACKGQPLQMTSHSVRAAAAIIPDQALISQTRQV